MNASLISIGDEILTGFIINSNAAFLGGELTKAGIEVVYTEVIADAPAAIISSLERQVAQVDYVIVTGGLGPTSDDITKDIVADFFGTRLQRDSAVLASVEQRFRHIGRKLTALNRAQADVPETAEILPNHLGTAPGMLLRKDGTCFIFLPGVPYEMKAIFSDSVMPHILSSMEGRPRVVYRVLRTTGIGESTLFERVQDFEAKFPHCSLAFLPQRTGVQMRIRITASTDSEAHSNLDTAELFLTEKIGRYFIGTGDISQEEIVGQLLVERSETLALAESCTGGLLGHLITNISGSSKYFLGGVMSYSNTLKVDLTGVPESVIIKYGAVSEEVATAMAIGVREYCNADWGLSITGIAGPGGGSDEKPVGLVFIGCANAAGCRILRTQYSVDRLSNKNKFAQAALNFLRMELLNC
ncbi:competence/damage-inducible protein A [bacterium]|nr:competence/damage-inducible protein A [bacterium]